MFNDFAPISVFHQTYLSSKPPPNLRKTDCWEDFKFDGQRFASIFSIHIWGAWLHDGVFGTLSIEHSKSLQTVVW